MKKYIVSAFLVVIVSVCCLVPAHADKITTIAEIIGWGTNPDLVNVGEDELVARRDKVLTVWQPYSSIGSMARAYLSYDALSALALDLNSSGYPCYLEFNRNLQLYVIRGTGQVETLGAITILDRYLTNGERGLFCCQYNTDSLLSSVNSTLESLDTFFTSRFDNWLTNLSSSLDTHFSRVRLALDDIQGAALNISTSVAGLPPALSTFAEILNSALFEHDYTDGVGIASLVYELRLAVLQGNSYLTAISTKLDNLPDGSASVDIDTAPIVTAIDGLTSLFSLGDIQSIEVGKSAGFTAPKGSAQSVSVSCADDTGYVLFSEFGVILPNPGSFNFSSLFLTSPSIGCLGYEVSASCDSFDYSVIVSGNEYSGTLRLFDSSGSQLSFESGDLLRPSATVNHWEVARVSGGVVGIDSCTGLEQGLRFEDIFPRCALVPVRDLIAAPSLFASYCYQVGYGRYPYAGCSVLNATDSVLTVEYVNPSSLLNWFVNRQSDFRYWLDGKLNGFSFSGSSDLTSVTARLDTIIEQLQTTSGESSCDHTYIQDVTQVPTCILPGLQVSTCSQCGDSYSEILAALGHDWQCTSHVEAVTDPDTGEVTQSGYDIYTCSRCGDTYNDYAGDGAPSDYGDTSISKIIVKLFSKLGTFVGKIISWIIGLFDKILSGLNDIITQFSDLTTQITGFGGDFPTWLSGFWGILPQEFQLALTFSFVCVFIGVIGRKLFFA